MDLCLLDFGKGEHTINLKYTPNGFVLGVCISIYGCFMLIILTRSSKIRRILNKTNMKI